MQGLRLIIWGMFKKVVIADSLAPVVDDIFSNYQYLGGGILWLGAIYFAFQIYYDFSGYSDIAIGVSKLLGFKLMSNFEFPYFSRNIGEFWRRWHISLSTWFRDYIYIPLGGSKEGKLKSIRNIFLIFTVSGFWHGANFSFVFWGLFHSLLFIPSFLLNTNRKYKSSIIGEKTFFPTPIDFLQTVFTFFLVTVGWIFFRSENISESFDFIFKMFLDFSFPNQIRSPLIFYVLPLIVLEYLMRHYPRLNFKFRNQYIFDLVFLTILVILIIFNFGRAQVNFIYFQF